MATKKIVEKKTGEKYASKKAMMKHEKKESKAGQKSPALMKSAAYMKASDKMVPAKMKMADKKAPTKMKKC